VLLTACHLSVTRGLALNCLGCPASHVLNQNTSKGTYYDDYDSPCYILLTQTSQSHLTLQWPVWGIHSHSGIITCPSRLHALDVAKKTNQIVAWLYRSTLGPVTECMGSGGAHALNLAYVGEP